MTGGEPVTGAEQVVVDRFDVANAAFWLDQIACWLDDPGHADQLATDLWAGANITGTPLTVVISRSAAALRATLTLQEVR